MMYYHVYLLVFHSKVCITQGRQDKEFKLIYINCRSTYASIAYFTKYFHIVDNITHLKLFSLLRKNKTSYVKKTKLLNFFVIVQ